MLSLPVLFLMLAIEIVKLVQMVVERLPMIGFM